MKTRAQAKYVRYTPMKARRVVGAIHDKRVVEVVSVLRFTPQVAAVPVRKVLESTIANARLKAEHDGERFDENDLFIIGVFAGEGPTLKRFRPRVQGRTSGVLKRIGRVTVIVGGKSDTATKEGVR